MAVEIERKFLVRTQAWRQAADPGRRLRQAYLSNSRSNTTRIRIVDDNQAWLTIKSAFRGIVRDEFEYEVPIGDALSILQLRDSGIIDKVRHIVVSDGFEWEVDEFSGDNAGLVIAEIELSDETQAFSHPEWLGKEITGEPRYQNSELAIAPYATWTPEPI